MQDILTPIPVKKKKPSVIVENIPPYSQISTDRNVLTNDHIPVEKTYIHKLE
jgi:hypothetical protein